MMNKNFFGKAVFFFLVSGLFAESYVSRFYRGNIADKNKIVQEASESGDESIAMETLDFAVTAYGAMGDDEELVTLTETAVKSLSGGKEKIVSEKLRKIFKLFNDTRIKIAVLDAFSVFQATENLYLVNDFFYERMQKSAEVDEAILKSILYMGTYGNSAFYCRHSGRLAELFRNSFKCIRRPCFHQRKRNFAVPFYRSRGQKNPCNRKTFVKSKNS
jgi:hypothetical protein